MPERRLCSSALVPQAGMDAYQLLATAVVGGLLVGTILSLFDIPIIHIYVDNRDVEQAQQDIPLPRLLLNRYSITT